MTSLKYLFGPVPSRRLGRSLGVNIIPSKICSLNCIYCEVGPTKSTTMLRQAYYKSTDIIKEFEEHYYKFKDLCDVITITGAGEPTLNSQLDDILSGIKALTDKKIAILTNTTTIHIKNVYETLLKFDIVVPSLDGVDSHVFNSIDLPNKDIDINNIIKYLTLFSHDYSNELFIEILFCKGKNDSLEHINKLVEVLKKMKITKVQIGTIHRPPAYSNAYPVDNDFLLNTSKIFLTNNIPTEITSGFSGVYTSPNNIDLTSLIPTLIKMRPCTIYDMMAIFGKNKEEIIASLDILMNKHIIKKETYNGDVYYTIIS